MRTDRIDLWIGKADGTVMTVVMRFNGSHQRGYRCYFGAIADLPENILESTPPSFEGRRLFDALAGYRNSIEPKGWRLLHAIARRDCWPRPLDLDSSVQRLQTGVEETQAVNGFERAEFSEVATFEEQQAAFEQWMRSLAPVYSPRAARKAGHGQDEAVVDFGPLAMLAGEYLASDEPDARRAARKSLDAMRRKRRSFPH